MTTEDRLNPLTLEELFCLEGCGSYKQYFRMRKGFEDETCPFCTVDRTFNQVLWEDNHAQCWEVPQGIEKKGFERHLIVTPKRHVRTPWELTRDEALSMHIARSMLATMFDLPGGGVIIRFGDMRRNAGTVPHLHENIMVPDGTAEVRIPLFKNPEDRQKNGARATEFAKRYETGELP